MEIFKWIQKNLNEETESMFSCQLYEVHASPILISAKKFTYAKVINFIFNFRLLKYIKT
jgi:hypothetical protein